MTIIKSALELERLRAANAIVAEVHIHLARFIAPGIMTVDIDELAEKVMRERGAESAFKGYRGYPANVCTSVDEEVVHGLPSRRKLVEGCIVSVDVGVRLDGYCGDATVTYEVGGVSPEARRLVSVTREALLRAVRKARVGNRLSDISWAIQSCAEEAHFSVVRDFVGHGIGTRMHEEPQVPNFGKPHQGPRLKAGMVLAIEPMLNAGTFEVEVKEDGWTVVTKDARLSAHFEHCVAILDEGPEVLSALPGESWGEELVKSEEV